MSYFNLINISVCIIVVFLLGENLRGDLKLNFLIGKLYSVSVSYSSSVVLGFFSRICCFTKKNTHTTNQKKKKSSSYHFFHKFFKYILRFFFKYIHTKFEHISPKKIIIPLKKSEELLKNYKKKIYSKVESKS